MTDKNNSNYSPVVSEAQMEEMRILREKVNRQDVQIRQLAKKIGIELPE